jgi:hypothetical protein
MHFESHESISCGTKSHLDVAPMESCRVYYKGEGGGFPQVRVVVSLMCLNYPWFILEPKVLQLCTNRAVLVLCRSVWIIKACQFFLVPSRSSSTPLYPSKCSKPKSNPNSLLFHCFEFGIHIWVPKRVGNASYSRLGNSCAPRCPIEFTTRKFPRPVLRARWYSSILLFIIFKPRQKKFVTTICCGSTKLQSTFNYRCNGL